MDARAGNDEDDLPFPETQLGTKSEREVAKHLSVGIIPNPGGSGKTRRLCQRLTEQYRDGNILHAIVASPTKELIAQTYATLIEMGVPERHVKQIHTGTGGKKTIRVQMQQFLQKMSPEDHTILLLTHAGLQLERPDTIGYEDDPRDKEAAAREDRPCKKIVFDVWKPCEWDIYWDEAPEILQFDLLYAPRRHYFWSSLMKAVPHGPELYRLMPKVDFDRRKRDTDDDDEEDDGGRKYTPVDALKTIARNKPFDMHEKPVQQLCGNVANSNKLVLVMPEHWDNLMDPLAYKDKKTYLMGALDIMTIHHPNS